jgi:DNA repair exonuclease SbcCD nuclease subunit
LSRVTFIHAADLHLDSPFVGLKHLPQALLTRVQESTFVSFQRIIDYAIKNKVDFIIIAGDLYDSEQRSLKAQIRFRNEMYRLEREGIHAYIIHGNHDPLSGNWINLDWPSNVYFFGKDITSFPFHKDEKLIARLYGFSYNQKEVLVNKAIDYEKTFEDCFHIGILHGTISSNLEHTPYAPFQINDLISKDFHYWALGHIHQRQIVEDSPPIVYPGNIQGRHRKETGKKGCYLVEMTEQGHDLTFLETCDVIWESVTISVNELHTVDELMSSCQKALEELRGINKGVFVHMRINGQSELSPIIQDSYILEEILDNLNDGEESREDFVFICSYDNQTQLVDNYERLKNEQHFLSDLLKQIEDYDGFDEALAPLFEHRQGRRYLSHLDDEEKIELLKETETWVINELMKATK